MTSPYYDKVKLLLEEQALLRLKVNLLEKGCSRKVRPMEKAIRDLDEQAGALAVQWGVEAFGITAGKLIEYNGQVYEIEAGRLYGYVERDRHDGLNKGDVRFLIRFVARRVVHGSHLAKRDQRQFYPKIDAPGFTVLPNEDPRVKKRVRRRVIDALEGKPQRGSS